MFQNKTISYIGLVVLHLILGVAIYSYSKLSIPYGLAILSVGLLVILKTHNDKNQVLYIVAYTVGSEVLMRMAGGFIFYEIAKYSIIVFMIMSIYLSGFSKNSFFIWIFLLALIPGLIVATINLRLDSNIIKSISFNLSGPLCLGVCSLYSYQRKVSLPELENILLTILLPIISTVTYMYLYTPNVKDVITGTDSNFETSGGFGPNQVATIIGLGVFILFTRIVFYSKEKKIMLLNVFLLLVITFRGIVTFSRGGMMCAGVMIVLFILVLFQFTKRKGKIKILWLVGASILLLSFVWSYSLFQTSGLIEKRYANQDAAGRIKASQLSGREHIMEGEYEIFLDHPFLGIGIGKARESRLEESGEVVASHNEITRMLAEHGSFGVLAMLILIVTPLALYVNNRFHIYLLPLFVFWILTINHAAMRLSAPAFVYALTLLHVYSIEEQKKLNQNLKEK